jgi:hypothetical protein
MTKLLTSLSIFLAFNLSLSAQSARSILRVGNVKTIDIAMHLDGSVTQQAGTQAIDFKTEAQINHRYQVVSRVNDATTLRHEITYARIDLDGMGQKHSYDSKSKKDNDHLLSSRFNEIISRKFDIIIDSTGSSNPVKTAVSDSTGNEEPFSILSVLFRDVSNIAYAPKKTEPGFFKILPEKPVNVGEAWTDSVDNASGKLTTTYTLREVTDSLIKIDFRGQSFSVYKASMMGVPTTIILNGNSSGFITIDSQTGLIRSKETTTEFSGNTEAMGNTTPVTAKTVLKLRVVN